MKFLEAQKILSQKQNGRDLYFNLGISSTADQLCIFIKAISASLGYNAQISVQSFGTLVQILHSGPKDSNKEVFLLAPWDFIPQCDWRTGFPSKNHNFQTLYNGAYDFFNLIKKRKNAELIYLPASIPPILPNQNSNIKIAAALVSLATDLGAHILDESLFNLEGYLSSGTIFNGANQGHVAEIIAHKLIGTAAPIPKIVVTDLDNVMWSGSISEDGITGIAFGPLNQGFPHFLYQGFLLRLIRQGILVAAVSRNSASVALEPFKHKNMLINEEHLLTIRADYNAKSEHIKALAEELNLGLESFVFIDDNPVEIAEVSKALPEVHCLQFPTNGNLAFFFKELGEIFDQRLVTKEDKTRTKYYRQMLSAKPNMKGNGTDLTQFLKNLEMVLEIKCRAENEITRPVQLINKTNQFNLNGNKFSEHDITNVLGKGGKLYTGTLSDNTGSHGEVLICLLDASNKVLSFVMSCRIFQRQAEYAFMIWILKKLQNNIILDFKPTNRNEPFQNFIKDDGIVIQNKSSILIDSKIFQSKHISSLNLFLIVDP